MTDLFHAHVHQALQNPALQQALDANAERRLKVRMESYASLPEDIHVLRQRAHALRAETIAHLDEYLEQFIAKAEANGMIVHRAVDAAEARRITLHLIKSRGARLVAKSKTMLGEEIELNPMLEAEGIRVVETDLGEYIVQLRGERPAHLITPAVHLRREDVAKTFEEKLGLPYSTDIPTMTAAARRILRQVFLDAEVGISGVNIGVAETGSLCLFTNEGNGRMVTTVPPLHIALMGIERLVPTLDDLALLVSLLPRSATGQKMTVYTSMIHGPRRPGDADGPQERHLILIDNGRQALRNSPLAESLLCIRCGACLNACPVFREIGGHGYISVHNEGGPYSGPIGSVIMPAYFGYAEFGQLARASSLCGACKEACPVDINLPLLLLRVRAGLIDPPTTPPAERAQPNAPATLKLGLQGFSWIASSAWRFEAAQRMAGLFSRLLAPVSPWLRLPAFTGWGYRRDFPRPATRPFRARWRERAEATGTAGGKAAAKPEGVATAVAGAQQPSQAALIETPPTGMPLKPPTSPENLRQRFESEIEMAGGHFIACNTDELATRVVGLLQEMGIEALVAWDETALPAGLLAELAARGIRITAQADPQLRAGLTGALAGIADVGTLVVPCGAGRPASASLLPEVHLAILHMADIYPNLQQALQLPEVRTSPVTTLITGPSRTADIEMTLTIGVHGPGQIFVFCIP